MEYKDPYLVIGTGRCGTSTVARLMHTQMGICMMEKDAFDPDKNNTKGFFEDYDFKYVNDEFLFRGMTYPKWLTCVSYITQERRKLKRPWGFKDPYTADIL